MYTASHSKISTLPCKWIMSFCSSQAVLSWQEVLLWGGPGLRIKVKSDSGQIWECDCTMIDVLFARYKEKHPSAFPCHVWTKQVYHVSPELVIYIVPAQSNRRVDPRPPAAGSFWRAWDDFLIIKRELVCIQERHMQQTGPAWNREQALLHQLVGLWFGPPTICSPGRRTTTSFRGAAWHAFRCNKVSNLCG
jgi:hypothetical protein